MKSNQVPDKTIPATLEQALIASALESERIAALIRVIILLTLIAAVLSARALEADHNQLEFAVFVYGLGTIIGLIAAWRRFYHPLLPYLLVGFDVITLTSAIVMIGASWR